MWTEEDLARIGQGLAWAVRTLPTETDLEELIQRAMARRSLGEDLMPGTKRRFTVHEYLRMAEVGILGEFERLELIGGEIFLLHPIENPHASGVRRLLHTLTLRLGDRALVDAQNPILLSGQRSIPRPDITILRPKEDFYASGTPQPEDILLVIEVADSTSPYDRTVKVLLYAAAGIPEIWLANPNARKITTYRRPTLEGYQEVREYRSLEQIAPEAFPDERFQMGELVG